MGLSLSIVFVALVGSYVGYVYYQSTRIHHIKVEHLTAGPAHGAAKGTENILMVGSTDR